VADVSAVADPKTGVAIYSTTSSKGQKGWFTAGGTLWLPIIAGLRAVRNIPDNKMANSLPYDLGSKSKPHDVNRRKKWQLFASYLC